MLEGLSRECAPLEQQKRLKKAMRPDVPELKEREVWSILGLGNIGKEMQRACRIMIKRPDSSPLCSCPVIHGGYTWTS